MKKPPGYLVILAVLLTSSSSIFIRISAMPPMVLAFYRLAFSAAILAVPFLLGTDKKISRRDLVKCAFSGAALALHFATWIASLGMTTVAASTVLVSSSPIFVALISAVFFRQKPTKLLLTCLTLAILGTAVISFGAGEFGDESLLGNGLALAGAFFVAIYLIIGQDVRRRVGIAAYAFWVYAFAAAALLLFSLALSQPLAPYAPVEFVNVLAMAVVCSVGGHTLYNLLIKYHGAALISLATLNEPLFASLLAMLILAEFPHISTIIGGLIVVAGVGVYVIRKDRSKNP